MPVESTANINTHRHECEIHITLQNKCYKNIYSTNIVENGSSVVECQTRNREPSPFAIVSKFGHFRSLHDASVDSAV